MRKKEEKMKYYKYNILSCLVDYPIEMDRFKESISELLNGGAVLCGMTINSGKIYQAYYIEYNKED